MKNINSNWIVLLGVVVLLLNVSCEGVQKTKVLKLAHALDRTHSVHKGMEYMAELVDEKSGGRLQIEIYPSQQLGTERECLELLQIGSLDMTKVSAAVMEGYSDNFKIFGIPYLFRDRAHSYQVLDGEIGQDLLKEGQKYWMRGLCYYASGSRSFYTKDNPIKQPDDLNGMKIRVMQSPTSINMVRTLGGAATPISFGELYTALQQGVVDGAENNPPSFYLSRHYEVCKYYSLDEHTTIPDILLISTTRWNSLTEEEQQWVQEAATESVELQRKLWDESEQEALNAVKAAGVEVIYPDKSEFAKATRATYEDYKGVGDVYELIQKIQAIQ
ncbi:MAG: TRAP transporter substrate-binding protein [Candidatus Cyclobacteriaceae bacterium M3_2C_046]